FAARRHRMRGSAEDLDRSLGVETLIGALPEDVERRFEDDAEIRVDVSRRGHEPCRMANELAEHGIRDGEDVITSELRRPARIRSRRAAPEREGFLPFGPGPVAA